MPTPRVTLQIPLSPEQYERWARAASAAADRGELKGRYITTWVRAEIEKVLRAEAEAGDAAVNP